MIKLSFINSIFKKNTSVNDKHYLGLFLKETEGIGIVMAQKANELEIINWQSFKYSNSWENLVQDIDNLLMQFESNIGVSFTKTIFFLYSHAINNQTKEVKPIYLKTIKNLSKNLDLKPLGYIEVVDAVIAWLEKKEESSLNTILVEIDRNNISVFIIRGSKKISMQTTARTDNLAQDVNSIIQEKIGSIILPSRFILYNSGDLSKDVGVLMSYRWDRDLFVQLPRIDLLKEEDTMNALKDLFAAQMAVKAKRIPEEHLFHERKMGFVIGGEVDHREKSIIPNKNPKSLRIRHILTNIKFPRFNWLIIIGIIFSLIALVLIELFLHQADLTINLPTQTLEETTKYVINKNDLNFHQQKITFEISQTKPTNGKKAIGEKAKGEITIHNFDTTDKTFGKGTLLSANNIQFTLDDEIKVASATDTLANGNLVRSPGKTKGKITAVEIGSESNLPKSSRFKIGDYSINLFLAINEAPLIGGSREDIRTVAKKDLDDLEDSILEKAKAESRSRVEKNLNKDLGYLDNLIDIKLTDLVYSKEIGEEANEVGLKSLVTLTFFTYKKNGLDNLVMDIFKNKINSGYKLDSNNINLKVIKSETVEEGESIELLVKVRSMIVFDKVSFRKEIAGKNTGEVKSLLNSELHAISYFLQIEPNIVFIKERMPWYLNNISIKVNY